MTGKGQEASYWSSLGVWLASYSYIGPLKDLLVNEITPLLILSLRTHIHLTRSGGRKRRRRNPTPPLKYGSRAMDQDSRKILIGGAVFLEKHGQAQEQAQDHSRRFTQRATLTQSNPEFAETVKILLDSMSLFLTTGGGSPFITACSLDLPRDEHRTHLANQSSLKFPAPDDTAPATDPKCAEAIVGKDQRPPKFTLRIARNGECSNGKNQVLKNLAREIITFLQTSEHYHA